MLKIILGMGVFASTVVSAAILFADEKAATKPPATSPALDALKKLVGEWTAPGPDGKPMTTRFKLTAGGSVLIETMFPETPQEMVTVYHMDGPDLILTHYCMLGNQPRLKAESTTDTKRVAFKSVGGTNMKMTDAHMGQATYYLIDQDNYEVEWCSCVDGKPNEEHRFKIKCTRKK
jgi:hypothetical protein